MHYALIIMNYYLGGLAQLARAPALQAGGQRFESVILHHDRSVHGARTWVRAS